MSIPDHPVPTHGYTHAAACPGFLRHDARPGLSLFWAESDASEIPSAPFAETNGALLAFRLPTDTGEDGCMRLLSTSRLPGLGIAPASALVVLGHAATRELLADSAAPGNSVVQEAFASTGHGCPVLPLSPAAQFAVESVRRCPFRGVCRQLALTARTHDLILAFLDSCPGRSEPAPSPLLREVVGRLREAAAILDRDFETPPSLHELAQEVRLSETSLKRGFPRIFGTTVFGYLRECRLDHARALIETGAASVLDAAAHVGYSNPSNFAAAFRARYGANPKAFQLAARSKRAASHEGPSR